MAILLFPTNEQGIVFITFFAAFFPPGQHQAHCGALPTVWEEAVRTIGGGRLRVLRSVLLPGVLPGVFGGLSVGMGVAWICVILGRDAVPAISVSATAPGRPTPVVNYPGVLVGMITIGVLGLAHLQRGRANQPSRG